MARELLRAVHSRPRQVAVADTRLTDPLGRAIVLSDERWFGHILQGHPDMDRLRSLVESTVEAPLEIQYSDTHQFRRWYIGEGPRKRLFVMVVADVARGQVVTAHFTAKFPEGELEWSTRTK